MTGTLHQVLLTPDTEPAVVADCLTLIEQEVRDKSGISGAAVKLAYKTAKAFAPGYLKSTVESLLPDLVTELEPFWADFTASGGAEFGDYLAKRPEEVCAALLAVTDNMAAASGRPTIVKAYKAVRGGAGKHMEPALPNLGAMIQKYA